MMKSEYDRSYQWNPQGDDFQSHNNKGKHNYSEPIMTHKRRVKLTEDNVIIGEPLPSQNDDPVKEDPYFVLGDKNKKFHPSVPYRNMKAIDNHKLLDESLENRRKMKENSTKHVKSKHEHRKSKRFANEAIQTENGLLNNNLIDKKGDKSTQFTTNVPQSMEYRNNDKQKRNEQNKEHRDDKFSMENKHNEKPKLNENNKEKLMEKIVRPPSGKTEYQTKYAWTEPIEKPKREMEKGNENKSKMDLKLKIYNNFMSEYQRQFRPYEFVNENRYKRMKPNFNQSEDGNLQVVPEKPQTRHRAITPPPSVGHHSINPQYTMNPQRLSFPHGKPKRFLTEYSANFDNKWQKLEADIQRNLYENEALKSNQQSKWFKDILDLRRKAQEYRQRSRGTHFSREHLGEIFTGQRHPDEFEDNLSERYSEEDRIEHQRSNYRSGIKSETNEKQSKMRINEPIKSHMDTRYRRSSSVDESISTSVYSSNASTIVEEIKNNYNNKYRRNSKSPSPKYLSWQQRSAGKPSYDNSLLLDEEASHDTTYKQNNINNDSRDYHDRNTHTQSYTPYTPYTQPIKQTTNQKCLNPHPENKYTFQRYFNENNGEQVQQMKTIDYDAVSHDSLASKFSSNKSILSTSTASRSLAIETLERAKRNRDEILRSKS